ncbi:hypothetical protein ACFOHS_19265 [Jhaorihella thermophila]
MHFDLAGQSIDTVFRQVEIIVLHTRYPESGVETRASVFKGLVMGDKKSV